MTLYPENRTSTVVVWNEDEKIDALVEARNTGMEWVATRRVAQGGSRSIFVDGCYAMVFVKKSWLRKR